MSTDRRSRSNSRMPTKVQSLGEGSGSRLGSGVAIESRAASPEAQQDRAIPTGHEAKTGSSDRVKPITMPSLAEGSRSGPALPNLRPERPISTDRTTRSISRDRARSPIMSNSAEGSRPVYSFPGARQARFMSTNRSASSQSRNGRSQQEDNHSDQDEEQEVDAALMVDDVSMGVRTPLLAPEPVERPTLVQVETTEQRMQVLRDKLLRDKARRQACSEQQPEGHAEASGSAMMRPSGIEEGASVELDSRAVTIDLARSKTKKGASGSEGKKKASADRASERKPGQATVGASLSGGQQTAAKNDNGKGKGKVTENGRKGPHGGRREEEEEDDGYPKGAELHNSSASNRRFQPIGESIYVPHALKHPFRLYPHGTAFDIRPAIETKLDTHTKPDQDYFDIASMPACEFTSRMIEFQESPPDQRKLLTLDLNGCLVVRAAHKKPGVFRAV